VFNNLIKKYLMEHVEKILAQLDQVANGIPEFKKACEKNGVPPGAALAGILGFSSLILLWF